MTDGFAPRAVEGPFSAESQKFFIQGLVVPLVAWADACGVERPPGDGPGTLNHVMDADLPLGPDEIAAACRAAFGEPRPAAGRGYPRGADWVVTTPMDGVYLTVHLEQDEVARFGWGEDKVRTEGRAAFDARQAAIQSAITETLRAVRAAMAPVPPYPR